MEYKIIDAAGGLVKNSEGKFLMIFRLNHWDLPKGKVEDGERIEKCAVREVAEETGLMEQNIQLGEFICTTIHHYEMFGEQIEKHTHWFKMNYLEKTDLVPQKEEDIEDAIWVTPEEAKENLKNTYDTILEVFRKADGF